MAADAWFLHKKDKYYGPFAFEKIKRFAEDGKIGPKHLVAEDASGKNAVEIANIPRFRRELGQLWNLPPLPPEPSKPAAPLKTADSQAASRDLAPQAGAADSKPRSSSEKSAPVRANEAEATIAALPELAEPKPIDLIERDLWILFRANGVEVGRYPREWFKEALATAEVAPSAWVQKVGAANRVTLGSLFPEFVDKTKEKELPRTFAERPPSRKSAPSKRKRLGQLSKKQRIGLAIGVSLALLFVFWLFYQPKGGVKPIDKIQKQAQNQSALRKMVANLSKPRFNDLVEKALLNGLNFSFAQILEYHKADQQLYNQTGPLEYGKLFPRTVFREYAVRMSDGYCHTYLFDEKGFAFAVVITHKNFELLDRELFKPEEFADKVQEQVSDNGLSWVSPLADGISTRLDFHNKDQGMKLRCLVVYDEVSSQSKVSF